MEARRQATAQKKADEERGRREEAERKRKAEEERRKKEREEVMASRGTKLGKSTVSFIVWEKPRFNTNLPTGTTRGSLKEVLQTCC